MGKKPNRQKTRIVNLRRNQEHLEFLGYQIGLAPVRADRSRHYWRMEPSRKAMEREVGKIWEMTSRQRRSKPFPELIGELDGHLKGMTNYYRLGQPRKAFQRLNRYVRQRLYQACPAVVNDRGNRPRARPPMGTSKSWDLFTCESWCNEPAREPDAGIRPSGLTRERDPLPDPLYSTSKNADRFAIRLTEQISCRTFGLFAVTESQCA